MSSNPTITIPASGRLNIANFIATFQGAGTIRIRETNLSGAEIFRIRFGQDGLIQGDFRSATLTFDAPSAGKTLVITQEGNFANSLLLVTN
jgi:hypothetical protein